ncbi:MAG: HEAT repeat domain-containing protein [Planctomycetaceae bacterium]|jgi:HEAT repeat protein|nr:HEAT repeat domain-containing protein [Planctomycetaceae bacterium]MBT6155991.1 HEAT repeat domain-containing protein [Planctomycetaceae bacterium]MBT6483506.1 HEAT repeat domain-containing protein [Planctomycetaceae bacterium]MBT6494683.1 HEAT repeat domain-containing protein [Planctomycetaceae bacterium]
MHDDAPANADSRSRFWNGVVSVLVLAVAWGAWRVTDQPVEDEKQALFDANVSPVERHRAAEAWALLGPSAVPKLTAALSDSDASVRQHAAYALGRIGTDAKEAAPTLMKLLDDEHSSVRRSAAVALGYIKQDLDNLSLTMVRWLSAADGDQRSTATFALVEIGSAAVPAVCEGTESENPETRRQALLILRKLRTADAIAITAVRGRLADDDDSVREQAYKNIIAMRVVTSEEFIRALRDKNRSIVIVATRWRVSEFGEEATAVLPDLRRFVEGDDSVLRGWAIRNINELGSIARSIEPSLIKVLDDESNSTRAAAVRALVSVGAEPDVVVPLLTKILADINPSQRDAHDLSRAAANALVALKPDAAKAIVSIFIKRLQDKDPGHRQFAAWTLACFGEAADAAVPALIEVLNDDEVSSTAAHALGNIGSKARSAVPALIRALSHLKPSVRETAAVALGKIGPEAKAAVPRLQEIVKDEESQSIWEAATTALQQIDPDALP